MKRYIVTAVMVRTQVICTSLGLSILRAAALGYSVFLVCKISGDAGKSWVLGTVGATTFSTTAAYSFL